MIEIREVIEWHRIGAELDALQAEVDALKRLQAGRFASFRGAEIKSRRQE